jgi:hypothetical protein
MKTSLRGKVLLAQFESNPLFRIFIDLELSHRVIIRNILHSQRPGRCETARAPETPKSTWFELPPEPGFLVLLKVYETERSML